MEETSIAHRIGAFFLDMIETIVIALSIFLVIYLFLMQPHQVSGLSMFPTYHDKEYLLTDKVSYKFGNPKRGDVVVFHAPPAANCPAGTGCDFIKRVIGLPGETLEIKDHAWYINGKQLPEPYIPPENILNDGAFTEGRAVTLGPDEYLVIGDNRPHSSDGRVWGPITKEEIVGRVFFRYFPFNRAGLTAPVTYPF
ncbi:MAG TPA: signal peptidase I [Patescibacteria group bacterium]|nr:signal peptidase I [Patescibacteria group bacterium]